MKFLAICGSLRKHSTNMGLLRYAQSHAPEGVEFTIADISTLPFYNADITEKPSAVLTLFKQIAEADALVLGCPEYNYSVAPALKNALDWASREPGNSLLSEKPVAIMGSGGGMGTSRAQYHLRQSCVYLNLHPLNRPEVFANAFANMFDNEGNLTDVKVQENIVAQLNALISWTLQLQK